MNSNSRPATDVKNAKGTGHDVAAVRSDFPILREKIHGKPLVYLDNAATAQKPQIVLDTLARYYTSENSNVVDLLDLTVGRNGPPRLGPIVVAGPDGRDQDALETLF